MNEKIHWEKIGVLVVVIMGVATLSFMIGKQKASLYVVDNNQPTGSLSQMKSAVSEQSSDTTSRIVTVTKSSEVRSSDGTRTIYVEKESVPNVPGYFKQSLVLEEFPRSSDGYTSAGWKKIISEEILTDESTMARYSGQDACAPRRIGFERFENIKWLNDSYFSATEMFDGYECSGTVQAVEVYNEGGYPWSSKIIEQYGDNLIRIKGSDDPSWFLLNICPTSDNTAVMVLRKSLSSGLLYTHFNFETEKFSEQRTATDYSPEQANQLEDCTQVLNQQQMKKIFP